MKLFNFTRLREAYLILHIVMKSPWILFQTNKEHEFYLGSGTKCMNFTC